MSRAFSKRFQSALTAHDQLLNKKNIERISNGVWTRYQDPILTSDHIPLFWRYDLNPSKNPYFQERLGVNAVFNPGAILINDKILLVARVEGYDRKSFFAVAESESGIDKFKFWDYPVEIPILLNPETNVYDMRLTQHEDGWIYGLFCAESGDPDAPASDQVAAIARCGIVRTKNLKDWERLPDLITSGKQQRNVVLHPEFINGAYGLYTRPQDGFIDAGSGGGIGWGLTKSMEDARIDAEINVDNRIYHTIKEAKNGQGPPPIKTNKGWIHLAHGVRNTAAGLRYVLYMFMTDLKKPWKAIKSPGGYFMAPELDERVGDVSNVLFCNGWVLRNEEEIFIYYASSDTRIHVATTSIDQILDYMEKCPPDHLYSYLSVQQRIQLIDANIEYLGRNDSGKKE